MTKGLYESREDKEMGYLMQAKINLIWIPLLWSAGVSVVIYVLQGHIGVSDVILALVFGILLGYVVPVLDMLCLRMVIQTHMPLSEEEKVGAMKRAIRNKK